MELGEREVQVPGSTHSFNIVHFLASSTEEGETCIQAAYLACPKATESESDNVWKESTRMSVIPVVPMLGLSERPWKNPRGKSGAMASPGVVNTSYQGQSHFRLLNLLLVRQTEPYRSASARERKWHCGRVYGQEEVEKRIWKIQLYTPLLSGYVLSSRLRASVAYFT